MNSRTSRIRRLAAATLVVALATVGLSVVPAGADEQLGRIQPVVLVGVRSDVGPKTPMWILDVSFTFATAPDCTNGAELHYWIYANSGKVNACRPGDVRTRVDGKYEVVVHLPVQGAGGDDTQTLPPDTDALQKVVNARGIIRDAAPGVDGDPRAIGGAVQWFYIDTPPRPVWIGAGDGYTSQLVQNADGNPAPGTYDPFSPDIPVYDPNAAVASWVGLAAQLTNSKARPSPNVDWELQVAPELVVARDGTKTADLAVSGTGGQLDQTKALLALHVHTRQADPFVLERGVPVRAVLDPFTSPTLTSWNWVGVSAGIVDVNLPATIQTWAAANPGILPWDSTTTCPSLTAVKAAADTANTNGSLRQNLRSFVTGIQGADPSVRVIQVLYPWLTEVSQTNLRPNGTTSVYNNPCAASGANDNRAVIQSLDTSIDIATTSATDAIFPLDLRTGFGNYPTGERVFSTNTAFTRLNSSLWLTRPNGYPYPTPSGGDLMVGLASALVQGEADDTIAPNVDGVVLNPAVPRRTGDPVHADWWNLPSPIRWSAGDNKGVVGVGLWPFTSNPLGTVPASTDDIQELEGSRSYSSPRQACDAAGNCKTGTVQFNLDMTAPVVTVNEASAIPKSDAGWYRTPVDVSWTQVDPAPGGIVTSGARPAPAPALGISAKTTLPARVTSLGNGLFRVRPTAKSFCDYAENCAPDTDVVLKIDETPPTWGTNTAAGTWYNTPQTVNWTVLDGGFSGPAAAPASIVGVGSRPGDADGVIPVSTATNAVCDLAGNCVTGTTTVRIDRQAPTGLALVDASGVSLAGTTINLATTSAPVPTCKAVDQTGLSGLKTCTATAGAVTVLPNGAGTVYNWTVQAEDNAGNKSAVVSVSYTTIGLPKVDGRMNGGGTVGTSGVQTSFTLRCNGSPNNMDVFFNPPSASNRSKHDDDDDEGLRFTLVNVTSLSCVDTPGVDAGQPKAPFDTIIGRGTGKLSDGRTATIEWTYTDKGEPGTKDTAVIVIKSGTTTYSFSGTVTKGNFQALTATGNGANNSGDWNSAGYHWSDDNGTHDISYDASGCHYRRETSKRTHYEDDDRRGNRYSRDDHKR